MNTKIPNNMNDMTIISMKSQLAMINAMQKVGKGKRKVMLELDKTQQKFLAAFMKELKKTFEKTEQASKLSNILYFSDYVVKNTESTKKDKKPKKVFLPISYEEQDFLKLQMLETINAIEENRKSLKWYNFIKKITFSSYKTQCEDLLEIIKKATK